MKTAWSSSGQEITFLRNLSRLGREKNSCSQSDFELSALLMWFYQQVPYGYRMQEIPRLFLVTGLDLIQIPFFAILAISVIGNSNSMSLASTMSVFAMSTFSFQSFRSISSTITTTTLSLFRWLPSQQLSASDYQSIKMMGLLCFVTLVGAD